MREVKLPLLVDATFTTPYLSKPFELGADLVVHSATKFLGGHGTHIGGAIVDSGNFNWEQQSERWSEFTAPDSAYRGVVFVDALRELGNLSYIIRARTHLLRDLGGTLSPFASFLFLQGLETLHLRLPQHASNAQQVAEYLESHPLVEWVNYPGLDGHHSQANAQRYLKGNGAIVGFGIRGGSAAGRKFIEATEVFSHLANIGDAKSLCIHPASTTHSQLTGDEQVASGVTPEYIRLSIGLEGIGDLLADLEQALEASQR